MYNEELDGELRGGPAYYIEKGLKIKWYAALFAVSALLATGFFLPGVQSNSIASAMQNAFDLSPSLTAIAVSISLALIVFGGLHRIGHAAQYIVPLMAVGYILVALIVVAVNIDRLPATLLLILRSAFGFEPAFAGILGTALSWGIKRGIYSNEAGQGTGPIAAATAEVSHPAKQGLVQAFSVYFDTWLVCTATAVMILITGSYNVGDGAGGFIVQNLPDVATGPGFTQAAVNTVLPGFGPGFVAISLLLFAFTTLIAYYYYAESNVAYLFHKGSKARALAISGTKIAFIFSVFYGAFHSAETAWALGDLGVGLMAWINIIAIVLLRRQALNCWHDYQKQRQQGVDPTYQK
jgi:AGCS family alanine or glycine:cation symporter